MHIETTRPELIPACVALIAHPDDERYADLFGTTVPSPLFGVELPVLAHPAAEPDKGAGIAMCCTFGDLTDVLWWRELGLPTRSVITRTGRLAAETPTWLTGAGARTLRRALAGATAYAARAAVVAALRESGDLDGEPTPTQRKANFYERGDKPLEIVTSRQWYIRNGGRDAVAQRGARRARRRLRLPPRVHARPATRTGCSGLNGDWLISRQRFFGVPIPVWYPLDEDGEPDYDRPLVPGEDRLPVDPAVDAPPGYTESQRGVPGGFVGDPDVMDTWATSSLIPQIAGGWRDDPAAVRAVFPMDVRPQGHDIIRTWLFSTIVRAHSSTAALPWTNAAISGWILDPDRKKMSKSKGNVVTPRTCVEDHSTDAVRYWAASGRLGTDAAYDTGQIKVGRRLAIKMLNASKFALSFGEVDPRAIRSRRRDRAARPLDAGRPGRRGARRHRRLRGVGLHPRARGHRDVLLDVLRRLPRAGQGPGLRRPGRAGRDVGPGGAAAWPSTCCCGCSRRSCPTSPRRSGPGGGKGPCTASRGRPPTTRSRTGSPATGTCSLPSARRSRPCAGSSRTPRSGCARASRR